MDRNDVIRRLKDYRPSATALGVRSLHLFGSVTRDEAKADSDIDVFVDYDATQDP